MASASASASQYFFTAGFGFGFGFPEFCVWLPRFNTYFDKTFIHKLRFDSYLSVGENASDYPLLSRTAQYHLSVPASLARIERLLSVAGRVLRLERNRLSDELFKTFIIIRCNGDV